MRNLKRRRIGRWSLFAACVLACLPIPAQQLSFKTYGQEQGLQNLVAQCMLQDRTGFLWVGTQGGLFRYDGSVFRGYSTDNGLPGAWIASLLQTADGTLWVATHEGIARRVGNRFQSFPALGDYEVWSRSSLASDAQDVVYVATNKGLLVVRPKPSGWRAAFENIGFETGPVLGVHVDPNGSIWLTCRNRVLRIDRHPGASKSQPLAGNSSVTWFGPAEGVSDQLWHAIRSDSAGNIWARSPEHLVMLPKGARRFVPVDQGLPSSTYDNSVISMDSKGRLFVPTDSGLAMRNDGRWELIDPSRGLLTNSVGCLLQDREGSYWIGLSGAGIVRWVGAGSWEAFTHAEGLSNEAIWSIRRDSAGTLWAGTDYGLNYLPPGERVWHWWREGAIGRTTIRAMTLAPDGAIWLGTGRGEVARLNPQTHQIELFGAAAGLAGDKVMRMILDSEQSLWVATRSGLYRSSGSRPALHFDLQSPPDGEDHESFVQVSHGVNGDIWAAGNRGLAHFANGRWTRFTTRDGLSSNKVAYLAAMPDGSLWISYRVDKPPSHLLFQNGRPVVRHATKDAGPRSSHIVFLRRDSRGWVWAGTDNGVDVFDGQSWRHYGRGDGLVWDDCDAESFFADDDGSVWIGTSRGLSHFRPPTETPLPQAPAALVAAVTFAGRSADPAASPEIPYRDRSLQVRFSALTFLNESEVRYRYRLLDLQKDWIETAQRQVDYPGLEHGRYTFEVIARNAQGVWSTTPASFSFRILSPWWKTWWFEAAGLLAVLAAAWQLWRIRMRHLLEEQERLEDAVEARTYELVVERDTIDEQNREIESLLERAQAASRAKSEFLANMSHEIRTPLNGVFGMTELALATELTSEQREYIQAAKDSAGTLLFILNDVLDLSKIEAGRLELEPLPLSIRELVAETARLVRYQASRKQLELVCLVDDAVPPSLVGDPVRLRQVLLNLLGNAIKFTAQGRIAVSVALDPEPHAQPGALLRFTVSDTGIGIPVEKQAVIFEAFRQADNSTTRKYGGTGLGLAISSRLVTLMGGRIWVESQPGQGSTFRFTALLQPCAASVSVPDVSRLARSVADDSDRPPSRKLSVLLAEDNPVNQKLAVRLIEKRGHLVTIAANGREAIALAAKGSFDVALMDIQMPEMDGYEATRRIREAEKGSGRHLPIIAMTACAMAGDREKCLNAGMDGYTDKPIDRTKLIRAVESAAESNKTLDSVS
ncbi:MAG TPA: ATP-binding protein [Bryobacteraceae bacterium]|nr:ATP-binding protein [Bryobacteraceae bacterium]